MSIGLILFILGVIYSIYEWIAEENKKKKKQTPYKTKVQKHAEKEQRQKSKIEQIKAFEARVNENVEKIENAGKKVLSEAETVTNRMQQEQNKVIEKQKRQSRQKVSEVKKHHMTLNDKIDRIQADPHLSERQKINRIQSLMMEQDIENAQFELDLSKKSLVNGIILSEVLNKPKSLR